VLTWLQSTPALSASRLVPFAVVLAFLGAAAVGGIVVASGNLVLMGLAVGAILGVLLLNTVSVAVWIVLVGTLLITGPLAMHFPQLGRIAWLFSILGFFLLGASILYEGTNRDPHRPGMPAFMILGLLFIAYAMGMLVASDSGLAEGFSAVKRYFQYWGVMFILATVAFAPRLVRRWLLFMLLLAMVQLPLAIYQRIVLMPLRLNMPDSVVPVDIIAGTFEGSITGGANSNVMAFFLIAVIAGLLAAYRESMLKRTTLWLLLAIVSAPLALGETKLVVVLLPAALLIVFADLVRKRPFAFGAGAIATLVVIGVLAYSYVALQATEGREGMTFEQRIEENLEYNFGSRGYFGGASLNRGNVVPFWWNEHGAKDPAGTVFGHGLGASFGARGSDQMGHMDRKYPGYSIGLTTMSALLWDVGLLGTGLFLMMFLAAFLAAGRLTARASPGLDRAMCRTLQAVLMMIPAMLFALDLHLLAPSLQVLTAFTLGLIAWRWRLGDRSS
jgi:hypothetical protein